METSSNVSAYCQRLKTLSDQLRDVGAPVKNHPLVLQFIFGLTNSYHGVSTLIRYSNLIPSFHHARSMLTLEEAMLDKTTPIEYHVAYLTTLQHPSDNSSHSINLRFRNRSRPRNNQNRGGNHRYHGDPCGINT